MLSSLNNTQKGILAAFSGFTSFAVADACAKWLGMHYEILHIIFWTYYISLVIGLCLSPFLGGIKKTLSTKKLHIHISRGVCALAIALCVVTALKALSLAMLYTILFLAPFLTTIVARPLYKEPVPFKNWCIIVLGFSGVLVAFRPDFTNILPEIKYAFLALIFIVALGLLARPLDNRESLLSLSFYPALTILILLSTTVLPNLTLPELNHIPIFVLGGLSVTIGLSGIAHGFRIAPFSIVAPIHYIQMVIALIVGYIVFNDLPDIWTIAGASIIIISGLLLISQKN